VRSEQPILFEVLHVQADGDERCVVCGTDCGSDAREPGAGGGSVRWEHAVRVFVAEIPRPERVVARQGSGSLRSQQSLRVRDNRIRVPVAEPGADHRAARDDPEATVAVGAAERPRGDPVHAAHVTREQRRDEREPELAGDIGDRDQPFEHRLVDRVRCRLEVLPGQEHPDGVEAAPGDPREVGGDLRPVELRPPAHRRARRPVVDAYAKPVRAQFAIRR
jgi:hypothetical protein